MKAKSSASRSSGVPHPKANRSSSNLNTRRAHSTRSTHRIASRQTSSNFPNSTHFSHIPAISHTIRFPVAPTSSVTQSISPNITPDSTFRSTSTSSSTQMRPSSTPSTTSSVRAPHHTARRHLRISNPDPLAKSQVVRPNSRQLLKSGITPKDILQPQFSKQRHHNPLRRGLPLDLMSIAPSELQGKTVFVRSDFNVTLTETSEGQFSVHPASYKRIKAALPTLQYLIDAGAQIVIGSHHGDPKPNTKQRHSLKPVAKVVSTLLASPVTFVKNPFGETLANALNNPSNKLIMLENLRFHPEEKSNDPTFAHKLFEAIQPSIFIQDSFSSSHRKLASTTALPKLAQQRGVRCVSGLLLSKELQMFQHTLSNNHVEKTLILGGSHFTTKMSLLQHMYPNVSSIFLGGEFSVPFAMGLSISSEACQGLTSSNTSNVTNFLNGKMPFAFRSVSADMLNLVAQFFQEASQSRKDCRITDDWSVTNSKSSFHNKYIMRTSRIFSQLGDMAISDIGLQAQDEIKSIIDGAIQKQRAGVPQLIIWNGPMGRVEDPLFRTGTNTVIEALSKATRAGVQTLVVGGETSQSIDLYRIENATPGEKSAQITNATDDTAAVATNASSPEYNTVQFSHISSGGLAGLELLSGHKLPGVESLTKPLPSANSRLQDDCESSEDELEHKTPLPKHSSFQSIIASDARALKSQHSKPSTKSQSSSQNKTSVAPQSTSDPIDLA